MLYLEQMMGHEISKTALFMNTVKV